MHEHANAFAVGYEYELNANNLWKGDIQRGNLQVPQFYWARRWEENNFRQNAICKDWPLVFLSPGDRTLVGSTTDFNYTFSILEFTIMVFEPINKDRNNLGGNESALREKEQVWQDTENILIEIMAAFIGRDPNAIYNLRIAGEVLGLPDDPTTWDAAQQQQADDYLKTYLQRGNFDVELRTQLMPFYNAHNDMLTGVTLTFTTSIHHDCFIGQFENRLCP
jgi:hypothetical protein